jgi:hypothetical protein
VSGKSATIATVRYAVDVAQAVVPIPRFLLWIAVAIIAAIVASLERIDWGKLLKQWAESTRPGMGPPPESPPMDMPEGGMSVPGPTRTEGEP